MYFSMAALHQEIEQHHSCKQTKNESLACSSVSVSKILRNNHCSMFYKKLLIDHHENHQLDHHREPTNDLLSLLLIQLQNNHLHHEHYLEDHDHHHHGDWIGEPTDELVGLLFGQLHPSALDKNSS